MPTTDGAIPYAGVCVGCGYDLRGLAAEGACPECGTTIAHSMAARGFARANHRWLGKMRIGAWLFLGTGLLTLLWSVLPYLYSWTFWNPIPYWLRDASVIVWLELLWVAAVWLLTSPEPGQARADSPRISGRWARWLCIIDHGARLALSCLSASDTWKITSSTRNSIHWVTYVISSGAAICLLVMMRQYAMRNADTKTARRLTWAAVLGGVVAAYSVATWLVFRIFSLSLYGYLSISMTAGSWVYGCARAWAVGWFALGVERAVHRQRPKLRLGKTLTYVIAALVVGGIAGQLVEQVLSAQAERVPVNELGAMHMNWALWRVGGIVGVALLPNRMAMLHRVLTRWRRREGMGV